MSANVDKFGNKIHSKIVLATPDGNSGLITMLFKEGAGIIQFECKEDQGPCVVSLDWITEGFSKDMAVFIELKALAENWHIEALKTDSGRRTIHAKITSKDKNRPCALKPLILAFIPKFDSASIADLSSKMDPRQLLLYVKKTVEKNETILSNYYFQKNVLPFLINSDEGYQYLLSILDRLREPTLIVDTVMLKTKALDPSSKHAISLVKNVILANTASFDALAVIALNLIASKNFPHRKELIETIINHVPSDMRDKFLLKIGMSNVTNF
jgi:hypothetical protein